MKMIIKSDGYIKKEAQQFGNERRFRASMFFDIFVPVTENYEEDKARAMVKAQSFVNKIDTNIQDEGISNAYFGEIFDVEKEAF